VAAFKDEDAELRWRAAWTLGGMKPEHAQAAIPALREAEKDGNEKVRKWAAQALEWLGATVRLSPLPAAKP
jgi:hypothetical protein